MNMCSHVPDCSPHDLSNCAPRDEYLATGVLHMTNAVSFLNNSCNMVSSLSLRAADVSNVNVDNLLLWCDGKRAFIPAVCCSSDQHRC